MRGCVRVYSSSSEDGEGRDGVTSEEEEGEGQQYSGLSFSQLLDNTPLPPSPYLPRGSHVGHLTKSRIFNSSYN